MNRLFTLYTHPLSANGRKPLALSYLLGLDPEVRLVNVYEGEGQVTDFLKIHPLGQIPTLIHPEKDLTLTESNAIMVYICETFADGAYYSKQPCQRAAIQQWLFWEASQWQPTVSTVLKECVGHRLLPHIVPAPQNPPNWNEPSFLRQVNYLNTYLTLHPFLVGENLTIADLAVAGMMTYFRFAGFPFKNFTGIKDWFERIEDLPAWKKSQHAMWAV